MFVLIFAGTDYAVSGAVGDDIDAAEVSEGGLEDGGDGGAGPDVAEKRMGAGGGRKEGGWVGVQLAYWCDKVVVREAGFEEGCSYVTCCSEDLVYTISSLSSLDYHYGRAYHPYKLLRRIIRPRRINAQW
jgi:hypothetical protein